MLRKLTDFVYVLFFGIQTKEGFYQKNNNYKKRTYIFDSIFPNEDIMNKALSKTIE